jgi:hypothetical protein
MDAALAQGLRDARWVDDGYVQCRCTREWPEDTTKLVEDSRGCLVSLPILLLPCAPSLPQLFLPGCLSSRVIKGTIPSVAIAALSVSPSHLTSFLEVTSLIRDTMPFFRPRREASPDVGDRFDRPGSSDGDDTQSIYSDSSSDISSDSAVSDGRSALLVSLFLAPIGNANIFSCLDEDDGEMPVYEAWAIRQPLIDESFIHFFDKTIWTNKTFEEATASPEDKSQPELANLHIRAIEEYQAKHRRRCWASRVLRGKSRTYDQHLDERCRALPLNLQECIFNLVNRRSASSSTRYRDRTWSVAVLRQRERYRFASAEMQETKRRRFRSWKNDHPAILDYYVVIRGVSTKVAPEGKELVRTKASSNPWRAVDRAEESRRWRDARTRERNSREKRRHSPPSYRDSRSPSRTRTLSAPSCRRTSFSPSEPDAESRARRYIRMSRYPPPPAPQPPAPFPRRRPSSREPSVFTRPTVSMELPTPYAPQHFGIANRPSPPCPPTVNQPQNISTQTTTPPQPSCLACLATPSCPHMPRMPVCNRFINWKDGTPTHPGCFICMATGYVPFSSPSNMGVPPPPPPPVLAGIRAQIIASPPSDDCWARPPSLVGGSAWDGQGSLAPGSPGPPPYCTEEEGDDGATDIEEVEQEEEGGGMGSMAVREGESGRDNSG